MNGDSDDGNPLDQERENVAEVSKAELALTDGRGISFPDDDDEYSRFRRKYVNLMEKYLEAQDELNDEIRKEHERVLDEYRDVIEVLDGLDQDYEELDDEYQELLEEYEQVADRLIYTLEDFSESKKSSAARRFVEGGALFTSGVLSADLYSPRGVVDFYFNAIGNWVDQPETAVLTLGLPALGLLYMNAGLENWSDSSEISEAAERWRLKSRDVKSESGESRSRKDLDDIDRI